MSALRPFWRYYGGKWRAAPRYPRPTRSHIVEPFAGSAGYALRYPDLDVTLVDVYPVVAGIWRLLISASADEIRRIPCVDDVDDLPSWVPQEARWLVGFHMNDATVSPRKRLSVGKIRHREAGRKLEGWSEASRERVASQVGRIRHWRILERSYESIPDYDATWFVDPPYNNKAGSHYVHSSVDYPRLAEWCRARRGQVIVCENDGAAWLPFREFATFQPGINGRGSREVIWTAESA